MSRKIGLFFVLSMFVSTNVFAASRKQVIYYSQEVAKIGSFYEQRARQRGDVQFQRASERLSKHGRDVAFKAQVGSKQETLTAFRGLLNHAYFNLSDSIKTVHPQFRFELKTNLNKKVNDLGRSLYGSNWQSGQVVYKQVRTESGAYETQQSVIEPKTEADLDATMKRHIENETLQPEEQDFSDAPLGGGGINNGDGGFDNGDGGFDNGPNGGFDNGPNGGFDNGPNGGFDNGPNGGFDNGPDGGFDNGGNGDFGDPVNDDF